MSLVEKSVNVQCSLCNHVWKISNPKIGEKVKCPKCGKVLPLVDFMSVIQQMFPSRHFENDAEANAYLYRNWEP